MGENIAEGLIDEFEEKYNIKVNEVFVDDNEAMYQELTSGKTQYDVAVPGDYMVERLISITARSHSFIHGKPTVEMRFM